MVSPGGGPERLRALGVSLVAEGTRMPRWARIHQLCLFVDNAAFGASAWNAQSALLQSRLSFAGAPAIESPAGANSAGISNDARGVEIHTQAALQSTNFNDT
jgi:hypothetical protein